MDIRTNKKMSETKNNENNNESSPNTKDNHYNTNAALKGTLVLFILQLFSRLSTFVLNIILWRISDPSLMGNVSILLEPMYGAVLFLSRENIRLAIMRALESDHQTRQTQLSAASSTKKDSSKKRLNILNQKSVENQKAHDDQSKTQSNDDYSKNHQHQKLIHFGYLPSVLGPFIVFGIGLYYHLKGYSHITIPMYLYLFSSYLELLYEPFFVMNLNELNYKVRAKIEGMAKLVQCLFLITSAFSMGGTSLLLFGISQVIMSSSMLLGYTFVYVKKYGWEYFIPRKPFFSFDSTYLVTAWSFTSQSFVKHLLTEGDKILLLFLSLPKDQGDYAFASNLGSLVARILFLPLEDTSRGYFSKTLGPKASAQSLQECQNFISNIMKFHVILGFFSITFGTVYSPLLIDILVGKKWSETGTAGQVLAVYCIYVPFMGINGISEAFLQIVAPPSILKRQTQWMIINSVICSAFAIFSINFLQLGTAGLVLSNILNMALRIGFSFRFIRTYFKFTSIASVMNQILPSSNFVFILFPVCGSVAYWGLVTLGYMTWKLKLIQICTGGILAVFCVGSILLTEKTILSLIMSKIKRNKQKEQ